MTKLLYASLFLISVNVNAAVTLQCSDDPGVFEKAHVSNSAGVTTISWIAERFIGGDDLGLYVCTEAFNRSGVRTAPRSCTLQASILCP